MTIQFFSSFKKKDNSTKRPSGTVDRSLTGVLKQPCSIMNPVVQIERLPSDANPCVYTYAIIPLFQRYYFITDWIWANGLWEVHMTEDVLATFKTDIGAETEYVLRTDSTTNFNGDITDTAYPATTDIITNSSQLTSVFINDVSLGCYVVGIISGGATNAIGAISYYAMTSSEFGALKNKLFSDDNLEIMGIIDSSGTELVTDLSQEVLKTMYNPYQYIVSCMWFPFGVSAIPGTTYSVGIKIGWWNYPSLSGYLLSTQTFIMGSEIYPITAHPQASRGSYLNFAPYTRRTLIGRFGTVAVDNTCFEVGDNIGIEYMVDVISGQCCARIAVRHTEGGVTLGKVIAERNFLLGVPIQIAQVGTDYLGTAVQAVGAVGGAIGGAVSGFASGGIAGAVGGLISSALSGIYNTIDSAMPQVETGGQNGSFLAVNNTTYCLEQFYQIVDEDIHHKGRPLCELTRLDTLSGFIMCAEGEIDISCFDDERKEIVRYLTTGFFWE